MSTGATRAGEPSGANEVHLIGRVTTAPEERELPSGDAISTFRPESCHSSRDH